MIDKDTRFRIVDLIILAIYVGSLGVMAYYVHNLDEKRVYQNCLAIENLKSGQREAAQATIDGDRKLLRDSVQQGFPLPVPRVAIVADIAAKQAVIDRYPERKCRK